MAKQEKPEPAGKPDASDKELEEFRKSQLEPEGEEPEGKEEGKPESEETEGEPEEPKEGEEEEPLKIDYEAELAKEKELRDKKQVLADDAFKRREQKREEEGGEPKEEKPMTASEMRALLAEERQLAHKEIQADLIKEKARKLAGSDVEANLIVEIHRNRTWPEGLSLDEQVEEAWAIANRKRIFAQNEELKRALRGKSNVSLGEQGTYRKSPAAGEPKLSPQDATALKQAGMVWDATKQLYAKSLGGGKKHLFYDPKTKKRFVQ